MKIHVKKVLSVLLTVALLFTVALPAAMAATVKSNGTALELINYDASKLGVKKLGETSDVAENADTRDPNEVVRVSIVLTGKSTLDAGFETKNIASNRKAVAYRDSLKAEQAKVTSKVEKALGTTLNVKHNLTLAMNVISAEVRYGDIEKIEAVAGVDHVELENRYEPQADENVASPDMAVSVGTVGAEGAWAEGYNGAGSRVAIVDTGLMDTHQSVSAEALEYALAEDAEDAGKSVEDYNLLAADEINELLPQLNASSLLAGVTAEDLYLNTKVAYHFNYVDHSTRTDHVAPRDTQGEHGSHVAGIAAANRYIKQGDEFVDARSTVGVVGNAPDAQLLIMKVFGVGGGAYDSDYMVAIEDAIILGADSVNLSLGSTAPGFSFAGTYETVLNKLEASDTVYCGSAGNSYGWDYGLTEQDGIYADDISLHTGGSPGSFKNSLGVAAAQNQGLIGKPLVFGDLNVVFTESSHAGGSISRLEGNTYDYVYIDGAGEAAEYAAVNAEISLADKIVITNRGAISFYVKGNNLISYNPAALVVANNVDGSISMALDDYTGSFPMVSITLADANAIKEQSEQTTIGNYNVYTGSVTVSSELVTQPSGFDTELTDFSSWGVPGSLLMKPEITAPGGNIRSINGYHTDDGKVYSGGEDAYELMSGTSMSSPQMAGLVGTLAQYVRENDLTTKTGRTQRQLIQSLLMSTAVPMKAVDGSYHAILRQGSGMANVKNAVDAKSYIWMNDDATVSASDGKVKAELGQNASRDGKYVFSFNIYNFTDENRSYTLSADLFTQALDGEYMAYETEALDADVNFYWTTVDADVDLDGDTDLNDVQAILDKLTGLYEGDFDADAADVDGDGAYTSLDAYILLNKLENEDEGVVLANDYRTVSVEIQLTDAQRAALDAERETAYVEGFAYVRSDDDVEHSIPILGVYGSWTDSSMFDNVSAYDVLNGTQDHPSYSGQTATNGITLRANGSTYFFSGNPYTAEPDVDPAKFAVSPKTVINDARYTLIRNAGTTLPVILDADGNVLYTGNTGANATAMYYAVSQGAWQSNGVSTAKFGKTVSDLGLTKDDTFSVRFFAVPEYYALKLNPAASAGNISADDVVALYKAGELGEGSYIGYDFSIDDKAPEILYAELSEDGNTITVTAQDDNYIAYIALMDVSGSTAYVETVPASNGKGKAVTVKLDITGLDLGTAAAIFVGDYAANEDARLIRFAEGPIYGQKTVYMLTNALTAGRDYVIANVNAAGTGNALQTGGQNQLTSSAEITVVTDALGTYIDSDSISDSILWSATSGITLQSVADGGYLGYYQNAYPFVSWSNAGYADAFSYSGTNVRVNGSRYMYYSGGYFLYGSTRSNIYLYAPTTIQYEIDPDNASEVTLSQDVLTLIYGVNESAELVATVSPIVLDDKSVTWTSSDTSVVTVDANGVVKAVGIGSATVTATSNKTPSVSASCAVSVVEGQPLDAYVGAQISTKDGSEFKFIDLLDMSDLVVLGEAESPFYGGGRKGLNIWGQDENEDVYGYTIEVDENGRYTGTVTGGYEFTMNATYSMLDAAPFVSYEYVTPAEEEGGEDTVIPVNYDLVGVSAANYFELLEFESTNVNYFDLSSLGNLVGVTYVGGGYEDADEENDVPAAYHNNYVLLLDDGTLLYWDTYSEGDGSSANYDTIGRINATGLDFSIDNKATSISYRLDPAYDAAGNLVFDDDGNVVIAAEGIIIADNTNQTIWYVDLQNAEDWFNLPAQFVGQVPGATNVSTLFDNLLTQTEAYESSAVQLKAAALNNRTTVDAQIASADASVVVDSIEHANAGNVLNAVTVGAARGSEVSINAVISTEVDVTVPYTEEVDVNNGLVVVNYDAEKLTLKSTELALDEYVSLNVNEEEGTITLAYATLDAIAAGEEIAVFKFEHNCEESTVSLDTLERNKDLGLDETVSALVQGTGHDYEFNGIEWADDYSAATATFTCKDCGKVVTVDADIASEVVTPATSAAPGTVAYTATVTGPDGETYTDTKEAELEQLDPDYEVTFVWDDDNSSAYAVIVDRNNPDADPIVVDADVVSEEVPATFLANGKIVYTATVEFNGVTYTDTKTEATNQLGGPCPWCGEYHNHKTLNGWWTALIHHILYILNRIFAWWTPFAK